MTLLAGDPRHGTESAYAYHRCRCDLCKAARRAYSAEMYRRNREAAGRPVRPRAPQTPTALPLSVRTTTKENTQ